MAVFHNEVTHIVQLGLGAAALTKFYYHRLPPTKITAVELDANVVDTCPGHFALSPNDERLNVLNLNAMDYIVDFSRCRSINIL
ncbi:hypothetical protein [Eoetvoesiella caeni]